MTDSVPRVTALRLERRDRVRVELDGAPWRVLPAAAVVDAGLSPGVELDRERARTLRRALRRTDALNRAATALGHRDRSRAALDALLSRHGVAASERGEALDTLTRHGYLDDARFAAARAQALAGRGYGDAAITEELTRQGLPDELSRTAVDALAPEEERARELVTTLTLAQAARRLAAKGFSYDTIENVVGSPDL
jgi:regulatory protein